MLQAELGPSYKIPTSVMNILWRSICSNATNPQLPHAPLASHPTRASLVSHSTRLEYKREQGDNGVDRLAIT